MTFLGKKLSIKVEHVSGEIKAYPRTLSVPRSYALGELFASRIKQIMSADNYPRVFSRQMEAIVYL